MPLAAASPPMRAAAGALRRWAGRVCGDKAVKRPYWPHVGLEGQEIRPKMAFSEPGGLEGRK
ncbi:hypothetical protein M3223_20935 [Paenibacillus pasadenensis]|nr:hypothetical protein [Paenibacillus pasadenensis]